MMAQFEYKFVRIGKGRFWPSSESEREYRDTIRKNAREGWRLVQVLLPAMVFMVFPGTLKLFWNDRFPKINRVNQTQPKKRGYHETI